MRLQKQLTSFVWEGKKWLLAMVNLLGYVIGLLLIDKDSYQIMMIIPIHKQTTPKARILLHHLQFPVSSLPLKAHTFHIFGMFWTVVHPKGIASEQNSRFVVKSEHGIRPMKVGSNHKLQVMTLTKIQLDTILHHTAFKGYLKYETWRNQKQKENCSPIQKRSRHLQARNWRKLEHLNQTKRVERFLLEG